MWREAPARLFGVPRKETGTGLPAIVLGSLLGASVRSKKALDQYQTKMLTLINTEHCMVATHYYVRIYPLVDCLATFN
jgi:hypothetical protein